MKTLVIKKSKWLRGLESFNSNLLDSSGKMCCLGFYAKACGATKKDILNVEAPCDVSSQKIKWAPGTLKKPDKYSSMMLQFNRDNTALIYKMMKINDSHEMSDKKRERLLTIHFKKLGYNVEFVP